jgi:hypothetical protein
MKKPTYKELERRIRELEAQGATNTRAALRCIEKASEQHLMASACIIQITALGGREIVPHFAIRDGLSAATVEAIKKDISSTMQKSGFQT